jgi:hypothetical protein
MMMVGGIPRLRGWCKAIVRMSMWRSIWIVDMLMRAVAVCVRVCSRKWIWLKAIKRHVVVVLLNKHMWRGIDFPRSAAWRVN